MAELQKAGILGAGMMGAEIALVCARAGMAVVMKEVNLELAQKGKKRIADILNKQVSKGQLAQADADAALALVTPTDKYDGFADADIVVEAILEVVDIKQQAFRELDAVCKPTCIFASNTSSISITKLAAAARPDRFVGLHFFSPVSIMKLVEVIPGLLATPETVEIAKAFCVKIGKTPIKVKNVEGFAVNRMLCAMMNEAYRLVDEGVASIEDIDTACKLGLGHPVGPLRLCDNISLDLLGKVHDILAEAYGDRFKAPNAFRERVSAGHYGRKTGKGWYDY
ncbi:MAG: 3-hydroxyacyl-CoA dehydrogenase family protein [Myxococcales bacterium]|nr:MAG: 3-hydroxyacyl-CoA dehydrogenase family protein [Myxococcales bacterium]